MARALFYLGFLVSFVVVALFSLPQKLWASEKCVVIWTASQGELRFPDKNYGESGLSLGREPGDENRIFRTNEVVAGNITPGTIVNIRNWEPERAREVFPLLVGKRVSVQAKIRECGSSAESTTREILEISIVQLPGRTVTALPPQYRMYDENPWSMVRDGLAIIGAAMVLSGGGHHERDLPTQEHTSPFNMPPPKEPY